MKKRSVKRIRIPNPKINLADFYGRNVIVILNHGSTTKIKFQIHGKLFKDLDYKYMIETLGIDNQYSTIYFNDKDIKAISPLDPIIIELNL